MLKQLAQRLQGKTLLLAGILATNVLNFAFNAYTGRLLPVVDYGFLALINTFWTILLVGSGAMLQVVGYQVARGRDQAGGWDEYAGSRRITRRLATILAALWLLASPFVASYFRSTDVLGIAVFAPMLWLGFMASVDRGFIQGRLRLGVFALLFLAESAVKLALATMFVITGRVHLAYLALPLSVAFAFATSRLALRRLTTGRVAKARPAVFPWRFLGANLVAGFAAMAFLSIDLLLAKHYLSPNDAGHYALLSLVGKMIYFFGSMVSMFMLTRIGDAERQGQSTRLIFWRTYGLTAGLLALGYLALGPFGGLLVPVLFGANSQPIVGYLGQYALGIALFTLANVIVSYRLAKRHYLFSVLSIGFAVEMATHIVLAHGSIAEIARAVWVAGAASFLVLSAADIWTEQGRFIKRAAHDAADLFTRRGRAAAPSADGSKRILILNWRDTKHGQAGGAETYIHELARRWHLMGHHITLFCGNDGHSPRHETIDGIQVIRRGGFHMVYLWAFLYYILRLRRNHDIIIDCHNGIPFFTPLYSRKPVYCVVHHVHQDVFAKYLNRPRALLASFLEKSVMPRVYRDAHFMTVSQSTRRAMMAQLGIPDSRIEIIPNGVDLELLIPGEKAPVPTVVYVGRLKAYKSVDVLIRAFVQVLKRQPAARLIIAGSGDDEARLQALTATLGLTDHVTFTGRVSEAQKIHLLQQAWVFVNPSYAEGWGITTIEANACGTPVIASDVPGLRDSVKFPSAGYLVEYGNVKAFARKIVLVLGDENKRQRMSHNANDWAHNFDWQTSAVNFLEVIS
jgi:glycosyltransferase involved in cell wall biosynthesis/O-antigen/teichoic acid export membrane protein